MSMRRIKQEGEYMLTGIDGRRGVSIHARVNGRYVPAGFAYLGDRETYPEHLHDALSRFEWVAAALDQPWER